MHGRRVQWQCYAWLMMPHTWQCALTRCAGVHSESPCICKSFFVLLPLPLLVLNQGVLIKAHV